MKSNISYFQYLQIKNSEIFKTTELKRSLIFKQKVYKIRRMKGICRIPRHKHLGVKIGLNDKINEKINGINGQILEKNIEYKQENYAQILTEIYPETNGDHIYLTIDSYLQTQAHDILINQLKKLDASMGVLILMEVKTGDIKSMVSLRKLKQDQYVEEKNYAISECTEPGSTFKTISLLMALEDNKININEFIETEGGVFLFKGEKIHDDTSKGFGAIPVEKILELSSNIAMAKIVYNGYKNNPKKFFENLYKWKLHEKTFIELTGETLSYIPNVNDKNWKNLSLAWMSFGYGIKMTPIKILTFYNAIANHGKIVNPSIIRKIVSKDAKETKKDKIKTKDIFITKNKFLLKKINEMLENVVKQGTAKNIFNPECSYAGKTSTTQVNYWNKNQNISYNSSFVGYFPSNNPKYSCIVVIYNPNKKGGEYSGSKCAAPVFDEIAKLLYAKK